MTNPDIVAVTDADREAVVEVLGQSLWDACIGNKDTLSIVQAFARHRAAAYRAGIEAAAKVADAEADAADEQVASFDCYGGPTLPGRAAEVQRRGAAKSIATAIRALTQETSA